MDMHRVHCVNGLLLNHSLVLHIYIFSSDFSLHTNTHFFSVATFTRPIFVVCCGSICWPKVGISFSLFLEFYFFHLESVSCHFEKKSCVNPVNGKIIVSGAHAERLATKNLLFDSGHSALVQCSALFFCFPNYRNQNNRQMCG